jgi:hypothetical protein
MYSKEYKIKILTEAINQLFYHDMIDHLIYKECIEEVDVMASDFELPENPDSSLTASGHKNE